MTEKVSCNSPVPATRRSILASLPVIRSAALLREQLFFLVVFLVTEIFCNLQITETQIFIFIFYPICLLYALLLYRTAVVITSISVTGNFLFSLLTAARNLLPVPVICCFAFAIQHAACFPSSYSSPCRTATWHCQIHSAGAAADEDCRLSLYLLSRVH